MRRLALRLLIAAGLVLLVTGSALAALQIVWGPVLGDLTSDSVQIAWFTNLPSYGAVEVGGQRLAPGGPSRAHQVKISGLRGSATYSYRLTAQTGDQATASKWYSFETPGPELSSFTFCAYGDTRSNPTAHRQVVEAMVSCKPRFILHSGDLVARGADLEGWKRFFPVIARFSPQVPLYPCLGNHEGGAALYYDLLPLPEGGGVRNSEWYAAIFGSCQLFSLDNYGDLEAQAAWLKDQLSQPRPEGVQWRLALFHEPPYSSGPHPPSAGALKHFCPYLENGGVDLVLNGHNHLYERSLVGRLNYVTVGGGGAPLYAIRPRANPYRQALAVTYSFLRVEVTPQELRCTALDTELLTLDSFTVEARS